MLTLGTVIMRLSDTKNTVPIPYRDSKLTRLLQPALEGDSKVNIICNISPCALTYEETLSTLKFAQRAKKIKQTIGRNDPLDSKALIIKYQEEIHVLQEKLREMEQRMSLEANNQVSEEVTHQLIVLQEEKEKSDAIMENILQEKLQLEKELERFRSFIIHPEDVKTAKISCLETDDFDLINCRKSIEFIQKIKEEVTKPSIGFAQIVEVRNSRYEVVLPKESLLTDNIDKIEEILNSDEPLARCSRDEKKAGVDNHVDCRRIIEEQDRIIQTMQKVMSEKDEEILVLKDELKLCRNNLASLQRNLRKNN